jgi:hypothetical protein
MNRTPGPFSASSIIEPARPHTGSLLVRYLTYVGQKVRMAEGLHGVASGEVLAIKVLPRLVAALDMYGTRAHKCDTCQEGAS